MDAPATPAAKVMEGKVPVSRSTSMASSIGRRTAVGSDVSLGRMMSERRMEARLRKVDASAADGERAPTFTSRTDPGRGGPIWAPREPGPPAAAGAIARPPNRSCRPTARPDGDDAGRSHLSL